MIFIKIAYYFFYLLLLWYIFKEAKKEIALLKNNNEMFIKFLWTSNKIKNTIMAIGAIVLLSTFIFGLTSSLMILSFSFATIVVLNLMLFK